MVFTQYGKILIIIKQNVNIVYVQGKKKKKLLYVYKKIIESKAKYKIFSQKDDCR